MKWIFYMYLSYFLKDWHNLESNIEVKGSLPSPNMTMDKLKIYKIIKYLSSIFSIDNFSQRYFKSKFDSLYDFSSLFLTNAKHIGCGLTLRGISIVIVSFSGHINEKNNIDNKSYRFFKSIVTATQFTLFLP